MNDSRKFRFALVCGLAAFFVALMAVDALAGWLPAIACAVALGLVGFLLAYRSAPETDAYAGRPPSLPVDADVRPGESPSEFKMLHSEVSNASASRILHFLEEDERVVHWITHRSITSLLLGVPRRQASRELQERGEPVADEQLKRQKGVIAPLLAVVLCLIAIAILGGGFRPWTHITDSKAGHAVAKRLVPPSTNHRKHVQIKWPPAPKSSPVSPAKLHPHLSTTALRRLAEGIFLLLIPVFLAVAFLRWADWYTWYFIVTNTRIRVLKYPLAILFLSKSSNRNFSISLIKSAAYDGSWLTEKLGMSVLNLFTYLESEEDQSVKNQFGLPHAARLAAKLNELVSSNPSSLDSDDVSETRQLTEAISGLREDLQRRRADNWDN
jgi:hypothetical protein